MKKITLFAIILFFQIGFSQTATDFFNEGKRLYEIQNYTDAIKQFDHAIKLNDEESTYYYFRGYAYYNKGENKKALKNFDRAIWLNPKYEEAYFERGNIYFDAKNFEMQIKNYDKAIELNPKSGKYYFWRGYAKLYGLKNKDAACLDFKKAIEMKYQQAEQYKSICSSKGRTIIVTQ